MRICAIKLADALSILNTVHEHKAVPCKHNERLMKNVTVAVRDGFLMNRTQQRKTETVLKRFV